MPARSVALVLAVLVSAHAEYLEESDEVVLLQNEVVTRTRKGAKKATQDNEGVADDSVPTKMSCQAIEEGDTKAAACEVQDQMPSEAQDQLAVEPAAQQMKTEDEPAASGRSSLGYLLDVLIIAIFADGMRRWNLKQKAGAKSGATNSPPAPPARSDADWDDLMNAALAGNLAQCETLLRKGVPLGRADVWGCTVLHAAAKGGCAPLVKMLLEKRAGGIDRPDAWDETPLHIAARAGHMDVCEVLLGHGAKINVVNAQDWTPLVVAADANQEDVCNLLMARGGIAEGLAGDLPPLLTKLLAQRVCEQDDTGY